MGLPLPDEEIEHGDDCLLCSPPIGDLWAPGETPKHLYVWAAGIEPCPWSVPKPCLGPPNNLWFKLTQDPEFPCRWEFIGTVWEARINVVPGDPIVTIVSILDKPGWRYFVNNTEGCPFEGAVLPNELEPCAGANCGKFGQATVLFGELERAVANNMNIELSSDLMLEVSPLLNGDIVFRYSRKKYTQCIYILRTP